MTSENGQKIENNSPEEEEVPQEEVPQEEVPQEEVPQEEVPQEEVPQEEVPQDSNVIEDNSEQSYEKTVDNQSGEGLETESARDEDMGYASETDNLEKMILSTGIRVGTPVRTKYMAPFIVRANPEGLYILDISKTLARIDVAAKFIGRANISKVAVTSAREYGKMPVQKFCQLTGATGIFGRFMPGTFTNPSLPNYMEPEMVIVTDPQADQQAVMEATRAGVTVLAISNSDNVTSRVDLIIPANNRGRKALATVYWLLAREVLKKQGTIRSDSEMKIPIDDFETKLVEEVL